MLWLLQHGSTWVRGYVYYNLDAMDLCDHCSQTMIATAAATFTQFKLCVLAAVVHHYVMIV